MVAIELKTDKFKPAYLGQLEFYLEALDQNVKLPHENPSIGILLCREKDDEVVKLAINRSLSPTVIADYETKLIPKELLRKKLNEFYALLEEGGVMGALLLTSSVTYWEIFYTACRKLLAEIEREKLLIEEVE